MTTLVFHHDHRQLPGPAPGFVPVHMYGPKPPGWGMGSIGGPVRRTVRRLGVPVPVAAHDFLTIAMAVTAADTFVSRLTPEGEFEAADGWARDLHLQIHIAEPRVWRHVLPELEKALRFLSGDMWTLELLSDGPRPPRPQRRGDRIRPRGHDLVCLFSGGLDSAIGTLDLIADGHKPLLVSHAYTADADKQETIWAQLPVAVSRFAANAHPLHKLSYNNDVQMRTRSLNFLAYGALVASTMVARGWINGRATLIVPENGLIALNPPLTVRRIGALSTRTTHPHFLGTIQNIFDALGMEVDIVNPYAAATKGEMLAKCKDPITLRRIMGDTVSCGNWKRKHIQCGKCVPCIIRRASFHAANIADPTPYDPEFEDLARVLPQEEAADDLMAMLVAARRLPNTDLARWVGRTGPLPEDSEDRQLLLDVVHRGMAEVGAYFTSLGLMS